MSTSNESPNTTFLAIEIAIRLVLLFLILGPVAIYVFSADSNVVAVIFLAWSILVSSADMVLKPLLLGRGVEVPMFVILLGAIGGMLTSGIVGLFIGAIVLALGYELLRAWLNHGVIPAATSSDTERPANPAQLG
jgi:predicted PurR-regulated permease PerM